MILRNIASVVLIPCLLLTACGGKEEMQELHVSGAKTSVSIMHILAKRSVQKNRPSGILGIFSGIYTSQGVFLPVQSGILGMQSIGEILEGQKDSTSDENFALLREVGDILQVNVIDALNRSNDRIKAIDAYTQSLRNIGVLIERKIEELTALNETQDVQVKEKRKVARDIDRTLKKALNNKDYAEASEYEEQLANANAAYAEISTKQDQTDDMIKRFETLLDVTAERLQAVENNREILIAGLRVIDVPGIADFNILEEGKPWRKKKGSSIFNKSTTY
ncbi:hypothetical protein CL635_02665 [bacterium]|nr:hypothetical protein [bacterium]